MCAGEAASRWLDESPHPGVGAFDRRTAGAPAILPAQEGTPSDPVVRLALQAAEEAVADARLSPTAFDRNRSGCTVSTSKGGIARIAQLAAAQLAADSGEAIVEWMSLQPNAACAALLERFDLRGPAVAPVAACATGLASVNRAAELIQSGVCDLVLAGSADASLTPAVVGSFRRMGVLARRFEDPSGACRPFDRRRDGFVIGEGAAVFVLEGLAHAQSRGARPYAEWVASGMSSDAAGLTRLDASAVGLTRLIHDVLRRAELASCEIDYANLHGTATIQNDALETRALKSALGTSSTRLSTSGLKGSIGHLLGAAGSVELAATMLAIRDGIIPPTANLQEPDACCDLDYTPLVARPRRIENALKLSLGFGGHLMAAVLRAV
jgi:3-oxoacyl-(acyl-carrier-protein) synthase